MSDIVMGDDYITEVGTLLVSEMQEIETILSTYIKLLTEVKQRAIMEGSTAEAFAEYVGLVERFKNVFINCGKAGQLTCENFQVDFDEADEDLY